MGASLIVSGKYYILGRQIVEKDSFLLKPQPPHSHAALTWQTAIKLPPCIHLTFSPMTFIIKDSPLPSSPTGEVRMLFFLYSRLARSRKMKSAFKLCYLNIKQIRTDRICIITNECQWISLPHLTSTPAHTDVSCSVRTPAGTNSDVPSASLQLSRLTSTDLVVYRFYF